VSARTVSIKTQQFQRPYGDTYLRAEVDFHLRESEFGGAPAAEAAIQVVKALWPTAQNVELTAEPMPDARITDAGAALQADRWIVRGTVTYRG
jgi:hypothetical protein